MKVACCQFDIVWEDKSANYAKVEAMVADAKLPAGTLLLLPEMFATGFSMNAARIAEDIDGPTARFMQELAVRHAVYVAGGIAISAGRDEKPRNEALLFGLSGTLLFRYAKMQPFTLSGESNHYQVGEERGLFLLGDCPCQIAICYDLRFPEVFRSTAAPELVVVIANWPVTRASHWRMLLAARAIENQAYVIGLNRCGVDPLWNYSGRSQIISPHGEVIADAMEDECVISAELNLDGLRDYRRTFPALNDKRARLLNHEG